LRGRKRSLFNGGVGVPALLDWPGHVTPGQVVTEPCSTLDYFPTIAQVVDYQMPDDRPLDGLSLLPILRGQIAERPAPIPYRFLETRRAMFGSPTLAMIDNRYKFLTNLSESREEEMCFDLIRDPYETTNLVDRQRDFAEAMRARLELFIASCRESHYGGDYHEPYTPVNTFEAVTGGWK
jgi:arylsulfatase A-like enzyme